MKKQIKNHLEWLDNIDGKTVEQAIDYLRLLPQNQVLEYHVHVTDDTGLWVDSFLLNSVDMSQDEILKLYNSELHSIERMYQERIKRMSTVQSLTLKERSLERLNNKFKDYL